MGLIDAGDIYEGSIQRIMIKQKIIGFFLILISFMVLGQTGKFQTNCQVSANEIESYDVNDIDKDNMNVTDAPENTSEPVPSETPDPGIIEPTATPTPLPVPADLTGLTVKHDDSGAILQWTASDGASEYIIYRKSDDGEWYSLGSIQNTFYEDLDIDSDQIYFYKVVPQNQDSIMGNYLQVTLSPFPAKVTGIRTTCQNSKCVLLRWNESRYAQQYIIYRKKGNSSYKKIGQTNTITYKDKKVIWGKRYNYKIIAVNENGESGEAGKKAYYPTQAVKVSGQKYSYSQMARDMKELANQYSDYCTVTSIGKSVQGRNIYDIAIGNPKAKKSLLVVCTLHAREYICSVVAMRQVEYYLRHYEGKISGVRPKKVLNQMQIHYIIMPNPDGVMRSQTKYARWKSNARGVDLNRNFPAHPFKVGGKKGREGYSGSRVLSEPESRAVVNCTIRLKQKQGLTGVINYHAMGQIIFGNCSHRSIAKNTRKMYQIAKGLTGYSSSAGYHSSIPSSGGSYREYVMDYMKVASITIEMGTTSAPCSYWEYNSAFAKNKAVVIKIANALKN